MGIEHNNPTPKFTFNNEVKLDISARLYTERLSNEVGCIVSIHLETTATNEPWYSYGIKWKNGDFTFEMEWNIELVQAMSVPYTVDYDDYRVSVLYDELKKMTERMDELERQVRENEETASSNFYYLKNGEHNDY